MPKHALQILALIAISLTMLGADSPSTRFDHLGHQLVCQCGCGQILLECNHVNCPVSGPMIDELRAQMATGLPDAGVLNFFIAKYGPIVLAAPIRGGFDTVAWIVPFALLALGLVAVFLVLRLWRNRRLAPIPANPAPIPDATRDRIRRETDYEV